MTSNYQRALELVDHITEVDETPRELVKQLHQCGLLAPELPEPDLCSDDLDHRRRFAEEWGDDQSVPDVWFLPGGGAVQTFPGYKDIQLDLIDEAEEPISLVEARYLAYALLAAVNHAEQEQP